MLPSPDACWLLPLLPPGEELRPGPRRRDEADLEVAPARVRDAEPHHDMLQVEHVLVAVLSAGAAEGAGAQRVVRTDVPAGDRQSIVLGRAVLPGSQQHGRPVRFEPGLLLLHGKNYLILHCNTVS